MSRAIYARVRIAALDELLRQSVFAGNVLFNLAQREELPWHERATCDEVQRGIDAARRAVQFAPKKPAPSKPTKKRKRKAKR